MTARAGGAGTEREEERVGVVTGYLTGRSSEWVRNVGGGA